MFKIKAVDEFNVCFSCCHLSVTVTDYRTHTYADTHRLPATTLLNIICNILNKTDTEYTVVSKQEWKYNNKMSDITLDVWQDEKCAVLTVSDNNVFDSYHIELVLQESNEETYRNFVHILTGETNA